MVFFHLSRKKCLKIFLLTSGKDENNSIQNCMLIWRNNSIQSITAPKRGGMMVTLKGQIIVSIISFDLIFDLYELANEHIVWFGLRPNQWCWHNTLSTKNVAPSSVFSVHDAYRISWLRFCLSKNRLPLIWSTSAVWIKQDGYGQPGCFLPGSLFASTRIIAWG